MLQISGVTKSYPGVRALHSMDLSLEAGQIHALVGENGAGKSTLIKILAGVVESDAGDVLLDGEPVQILSPQEANRLGIGVVHQQSYMIQDLSVAENFALREGYSTGRCGQISWANVIAQGRLALQEMSSAVAPDRPAGSLSGVERQLVELSFAVASKPKVLILDEPTAVLPHQETRQLFDLIREFAARGGGVLFISHRLEEVFELADTVTVLRDGERIWTKRVEETDSDDLIRGMVGRSVSIERKPHSELASDPLFVVQGLTDHREDIRDVNFVVCGGEIYGIYGLVGAGQETLCQALFGLREIQKGSIQIQGEELNGASPEKRVVSGLGYVPSDRLHQGMLYAMSVGENASLAALQQLVGLAGIDRAREDAGNQATIDRLQVRTQGLNQLVAELSGGNQQKVLIGRWLQTEPQVLILEDPTQGVDIGAKGEIYRHIRTLAEAGMAVILVSTEISELLMLAHRVAVLRSGEIVGEVKADTASEDSILRMALPDLDPHFTPHGIELAPTGWFRPLLKRREFGLAISVILLAIVCSGFSPVFATWENLRDILVNQTILMIGAFGVGMVILSGSIDISIGAVLGLSAIVAGLADQAGWGTVEIAGVTLLSGLLLGLINGLTSVYGRVHAIVITLGTMSVFRGVILQLTGGKWILNLSDRVTILGSGKVFDVPVLLLIGFSVAIGVYGFLKFTRPGRRMYALGSSEGRAAYLGITPHQVLPLAFAICGLLIGLAGLLHAGRYGQVQTNTGVGFELKAIAAAVLGGTHIAGGQASVVGIVLGTLLIGLLSNVLILLHVSAFWEGVFVGIMILLAVGLDSRFSNREAE